MSKMSQIRDNMLILLWKDERPLNLKQIAEKTGLKNPSAFMHLLWLRKAGYVEVSADNLYNVTEAGRESLGFPRMDERLAKKVLARTSQEEAFNFYLGIDQPLGITSEDLADFCEKIKTIDVRSIEFHMNRGDFESWIRHLGDIELARRIHLFRDAGLAEETLRERLFVTIKSRCNELRKILS